MGVQEESFFFFVANEVGRVSFVNHLHVVGFSAFLVGTSCSTLLQMHAYFHFTSAGRADHDVLLRKETSSFSEMFSAEGAQA